MTEKPLVDVRDLATHFSSPGLSIGRKRRTVRAVDGVSFRVAPGETYALVGESGCGKSTTGRSILRLVEPTAGSVRFDGVEVLKDRGAAIRRLRGQMQIVFQDPYSALNPRMRVEDVVAEPLVVHGLARGREARREARSLLKRCGIAESQARRFPHEFSGGQRQRIVIARALAVRPSFVVADEPVSALDVSIQAQILNLLSELQTEYGLTYLFISHDLAVVRLVADTVGVMYLGKIVEEAPPETFFSGPLHPYSQALLSAVPRAHPREKTRRIVLGGELPSAADPPPGCRFHTRCPYAMEVCRRLTPRLKTHPDGRRVACHLVNPPAGVSTTTP